MGAYLYVFVVHLISSNLISKLASVGEGGGNTKEL